MATPTRPLPLIGSLIALTAGCAFSYVAFSVAVEGTGAELPTGANVIEGTIVEGDTVRVPAGAPVRYGDLIVTDPHASRAVDHHWSTPVGEPEVAVQTADGERTVTLPPARDWKGPVAEETLEVSALDGIPIAGEHPEIAERQGPPYLLIVRGLRTGDAIVGATDGDEVTELYVGDRAQLEAFMGQREAMRWPMVGLMAIMGLTSLMVSFFAFRKAKSPKEEPPSKTDAETAE
ncbi:MAG: hypothetical protein JJ863_26595 [Deltaproteobacteria bacterium]|nr:hypothetical protein [Deltaproteobacteria bacterium]